MRERVRNTPTVLDAQLERREVLLDINKHKASLEKIKGDISDLTAARTALQDEVVSGISLEEVKDTVLSNIKRNLQKKISELKTERDTVSNAILVGETRLEELNTELGLKRIELETINDEITGRRELSTHLTKEYNDNEIYFNDKRKLLNKEIEELEEKKKLASKRLEDYNKEYDEKKSFVLQEEIRLARKKSDLNIYEGRLRKTYAKHSPDTVLVLES